MIIRSIREIVQGRPLHVIGPEATVRLACNKMDEENIGALAVLEAGRLVGLLSERDVIRRTISRGRSADATLVRDVMSSDPKTISADASLADALGAMVAGRFRHLPVMDRGRVVAMLSLRDIPTEYRLMFERFAEARAQPAE